MKQLILLMSLVAVAGCSSREATGQPDRKAEVPIKAKIELKSDLSAADFKSAVVGKWKSVFAYKNRSNIQHLAITADGTARLVVAHADKSQRYSGPYTISFEREPGAGAVTFATIKIKPTGSDPIVLSRVNFGLHNGVIRDQGLLLRIDREPHGALKRED